MTLPQDSGSGIKEFPDPLFFLDRLLVEAQYSGFDAFPHRRIVGAIRVIEG